MPKDSWAHDREKKLAKKHFDARKEPEPTILPPSNDQVSYHARILAHQIPLFRPEGDDDRKNWKRDYAVFDNGSLSLFRGAGLQLAEIPCVVTGRNRISKIFKGCKNLQEIDDMFARTKHNKNIVVTVTLTDEQFNGMVAHYRSNQSNLGGGATRA